MTLFPPLSDTYYVDNDSNILRLMDYTYAKNIQINQSFWSEADTDSRFHAGDMSLWNDIYGNLPAFRRRQFNFNHIRPTINMISGRQRQNRKSTICMPVESSDQQTSDQFSKLLYHANTQGRILETLSDAFEGALVTGMNLLSVWMDYRGDPVNGDIIVENNSYNSYLIDPYFKDMTLKDCNSIWTRKYLSRTQAASLLPGREKDIKNLTGWGNRDGKFQFLPESYNYGMQDLLIYDEFWYLDTRDQTVLCDVQSGETKEWRGSDDDLAYFLNEFPQMTTLKQSIPSVKLAIVVQGRVMYNGPNPTGLDSYNFVPVWAYYAPQIPYFPWRVQGVVRGLRDASYLYNRTKILSLDQWESQVTSGFIYKEDALVNPKDVFLQGNGKGIPLKANEAPIETLIKKIDPPAISPSLMQMTEILGKEIQMISGVNEELLGSAVDDKAGILGMLRQGAGLTTLQVLFDQLDMSQKMLGNKCIELMQSNWTPGKVRRILNEEPSEQFYNRAFGKYDAVVEEGLNTATQKQLQFAQMLQLREAGVPIPSKLFVESSTLQNKKELTDALEQQEQQQAQMAQQQQQAEIAVLQAQIGDLKARAMANEGLGMERASRVHENQALAVERRAAAHRDEDQGMLDRVRAVKELTTMDLDHLMRAVEILQALTGKDEEKKQAAG